MKNTINYKIYDICLKAYCIASLLTFICLPLKLNSAIALLVRVNFLLWLILAAYYVLTAIKTGASRTAVIYLALLLLTAISLILTGLNRKNIAALLSFLSVPTILVTGSKLADLKSVKRFICVIYFLISLVFIALSFTHYRNIGYDDWGVYYGAVTLGYANPNETAMYLLFCILILVYTRLSSTKFFSKRLLELDILYLCYLLLETECRAVLVSLVFVLVSYFIVKKPGIRKSLVFLSMCIPVIYILLALFSGSIHNMTFMGEDLFNTRDEMYREIFSQSDLFDLLLGDYAEYHFQNEHNGYMSILATAGIFGLVSYVTLTYKALTKNIREHKTSAELWALCGVLGIIVFSSTEAALLVSGSVYANGIGFLSVLMRHDLPEEQQNGILCEHDGETAGISSAS